MSNGMWAGFGKERLTPPLGTELAGYGYYLQRRATAVRDDLYARAVAFVQEGRRYCAVSCDLLGLSAGVAGDVRASLAARHGCPPEHAVIISVHTHTGPAIQHHEGTGEVDPAYVRTVAPAIGRACDKAFADMAPVSGLSLSMGEVSPQIAYDRTGSGAPIDPAVRAIHLTREGRGPLALVSFACHAVARGRCAEVSADYPGEVCAALAANGIEAAFLGGVCGDVDPLMPHGGELARRMAKAIAGVALRPGTQLPAHVSGGMLGETLRLMPVTAGDIRRAAEHAAGHGSIPGGGRVARIWEGSMLAKLDTLPTQEAFSVRWLRLGGVPIVALPFEAFTRTGTLMREAMGDGRAMVLGCADELLGYLPTREEMDKGSYAALESTFLYKRLPPLAQEAERLGAAIGRVLRRQPGGAHTDTGGNA